MSEEVYGLVAGVLTAVSFIPYAIDIFKGKVKPERASWLIWSITGGIAFFSQMSGGATQSLWFAGIDFVGSSAIFLLAIKYGFGGFTRRDTNALKIAGFSLILWVLSSNSFFALIIIIFIDAIGTALTAWKTYDNPYTETYPLWIILSIASAAAMLSVGKLDVTLLAYPFTYFLETLIVLGAIFFGRRLRKLPKTYTSA